MKVNIESFSSNNIQYPIYIGHKIVDHLREFKDLSGYSSIYIFIDKNVHTLHGIPKFCNKHDTIYIADLNETQKNFQTLMKFWNFLFQHSADRHSLIIGIGGGVLLDVVGFVAATYMRGVDHIYIPTTLLAQVDASVGGKVGVNMHGYKNGIGSFYHPTLVLVDPSYLSTLSNREFNAGFAEVLKHAIIADIMLFRYINAHSPISMNNKDFIKILIQSIRIKKNIVEHDITENNNRMKLNYGHTIGHAVEMICLKRKFLLLHGESVNFGMLIEARISFYMNILSKTDLEQITHAVFTIGFPQELYNIQSGIILDYIKRDKKMNRETLLWSLPKKIGHVCTGIEVPVRFILRSLQKRESL